MSRKPKLVAVPRPAIGDERGVTGPSSTAEKLADVAVVAGARLAGVPGIPEVLQLAIRAESTVRRGAEGALTRILHAWQLPSRRELQRLAEQVSLLRHRVDAIERADEVRR